jgi:hypothetical protein
MTKIPEQSWVSLNIEWYEIGRDHPDDLEGKARSLLARQPGWKLVSEGLLFDVRCTWHSGERQRWHCVAKFDMRTFPDGTWALKP